MKNKFASSLFAIGMAAILILTTAIIPAEPVLADTSSFADIEVKYEYESPYGVQEMIPSTSSDNGNLTLSENILDYPGQLFEGWSVPGYAGDGLIPNEANITDGTVTLTNGDQINLADYVTDGSITLTPVYQTDPTSDVIQIDPSKENPAHTQLLIHHAGTSSDEDHVPSAQELNELESQPLLDTTSPDAEYDLDENGNPIDPYLQLADVGVSYSNNARLDINTKTGDAALWATTATATDADGVYHYNFNINAQYWPTPWSARASSVKDMVIASNVQPRYTTGWFAGMSNALTLTNPTRINMSSCINASNMFSNSKFSSGLALSSWNMSNVQDLSHMFDGCSTPSIACTNWVLSNATSLTAVMFRCGIKGALNLSAWKPAKNTSLNSSFASTSNLTSLNLSGWNTAACTNFANTFNYLVAATALNISGWTVANGTNFEGTFASCKALTSLDLSGWNVTNKATQTNCMFQHDSKLTYLNLKNFNTTNCTNMQNMFENCQLTKITLGPNFSFKGKNIASTSLWAYLNTPSGAAYTGNWIRTDGKYPYSPTALSQSYAGSSMNGDWIWQRKNSNLIIKKTLASGSEDYNQDFTFRVTLTDPQNAYVLSQSYPVTTTSVTKTASLSDDAPTDESSRQMATENTEDSTSSDDPAAQPVTAAVEQLPTLTGTAYASLDTTTGQLTFNRYTTPPALSEGNIRRFKVDENSNTVPQWSADPAIARQIKSVVFTDIVAPKYMNQWFNNCTNLATLNLSGLRLNNCVSMPYAFSRTAITSIDLSTKDMANMTSLEGAFFGCKQLKTASMPNLSTGKVTTIKNLFANDNALTSADLSLWNVRNVTDASYAFQNCSSLQAGSFKLNSWATTSLTNASHMFENTGPGVMEACQQIVFYQPCNADYMFAGANFSQSIGSNSQKLDMSRLSIQNASSMEHMYDGAVMDNPYFGTVGGAFGAISMASCFANCGNLTNLDLRGFNTTAVTNMNSMFGGDSNLRSLYVSSTFSFTGKASSTNYALLPTPPTNSTYTGGWFDSQQYPNPTRYTSAQLQTLAGATRHWVWSSNPYTVTYNSNGSGQASVSEKLYWNQSTTIKPSSTFSRSNYLFSTWKTAANGGTEFKPGSSATNLSGSAPANVTLYAQWIPVSQNITFSNGVATINFKGNTSNTIMNLPSGMNYKVEELTPTGWKLVSSSGTSGSTSYSSTPTADFQNQVSLTPVSVTLQASKTLDGTAADGFQFVLRDLDQNKTLQTVTSSSAGTIQFSAISYSSPGTHHYSISEVADGRNYLYDDRVLNVTVNVTRNGFTFNAPVTYAWDDGTTVSSPTFTNRTVGYVNVSKQVFWNGQDVSALNGIERSMFKVQIQLSNTDQATVTGYDQNGQLVSQPVTNGMTIDVGTLSGQMASIQALNGTTYTLTELDSDGFTPRNKTVTGTISSNTPGSAVFVNDMNDTTSQFTLTGLKKMRFGILKQGMFTFDLTQDGNLIEEVKNSSTGSYAFAPITMQMANFGTPQTYQIEEVNDHQTGIVYDDQPVSVSVLNDLDANWDLQSTITYTKNGKTIDQAEFINEQSYILPETGFSPWIWKIGLTIVTVVVGLLVFTDIFDKYKKR